MSKRVVAFVDGFNLYHSISMPRFRKYRWLDLKKLVTHFLRSNESLDTLLESVEKGHYGSIEKGHKLDHRKGQFKIYP